MEEDILVCEDSQEGIFTGIYEAYAWKCEHEQTRLQVGEEGALRLFARYRTVEPDREKAEKVARTIVRRFGAECYETVCMALASWEEDKGQAVYRTVAEGLSGRVKGPLMEHLADPYVRRTFELGRSVGNERHHFLGFVRFEETQDGILFAQIRPKNDVVPLIMPHFADRFPGENFVIYDEGRGLYGFHRARTDWFLARAENGPDREALTLSAQEMQMQELFRRFCSTIMIRERANPRLQASLLPLRFRGNMTEFRRD